MISPSEELVNNQVVNDFDIEEDEIQIENRYNKCTFNKFISLNLLL